eukprot:CAMPEP_0172168724 /NCGR_PEP_ID=MMETSP1050-20130122/10308_1 /TAXON_ID=233186 /ORGANISM="Cryptomonas curvata, Strain CCAP979/52" /LENGTH=226 /DNA_ID=CAMNT_0012839701 /DNA_START=41 /DNA_END=717 /DNA_ORIENTATION=+
MATFLTSLPDQIGVDPNEQEQEALQHLRSVVRILERENEQFDKDCDAKLAYQRKQQERYIEENERLRMKVGEMLRPKISVIAAFEERQAILNQQVEVYNTAKLEVDERNAEEIEKAIEDVSNKIADLQTRAQSKTTVTDKTVEELEKLGYKCKTDGKHTEFIGPYGEKYANKNEVCRAMSYVPDHKLKRKLARLEIRVHSILMKFNDSLSVNKELRAEIEHLRKER